jgi:hypothetical protein
MAAGIQFSLALELTLPAADTMGMERPQDWTWIFVRGEQRVEIRRPDSEAPRQLVIADGRGEPRTYSFDDPVALVNFQADMEVFLLQTAWTFAEFRPERRQGRERRTWPRLRDRRRWWTDGQPRPAAYDPDIVSNRGA